MININSKSTEYEVRELQIRVSGRVRFKTKTAMSSFL
jgi:transposase-like protein